MNLRLFANPIFLNAALVGYVATMALFGAEFLMPVYLQAFRGRTALETGVILLAVAATSGDRHAAGRPAVRQDRPAHDHGDGFSLPVHQYLAACAAAEPPRPSRISSSCWRCAAWRSG